MNYLAHLFVAPADEDAQLGSVMGDFVKGPVNDEMYRRYGTEVVQAIILHRRLDTFTDAHPAVRESRNRISHKRRRFAGIMIDLFYDHFLARYWNEYHDQPLERFTGAFYSIVLRQHDNLPEEFRRVAKRMADLDWLGSYVHVDAIDTALNRMSQRLRRDNPLVDSASELLSNYEDLESDFRHFIPQAAEYAKRLSLP